MSDGPEAAIVEAIGLPAPAGPLAALGHAADWAAQAVVTAVGEDDIAAFECVVALDDVLPRVAALLRTVPDLVRGASPGQTATARLAAAEAEFTRLQADLAAQRGRLEAARHLEQQAAELEAERERLRQRIERLERSQFIERELPALRTRQAELEDAVSQASSAAGEEVVLALETAGRRLLELTEEQASLLAVKSGQLVPALAVAASSLAQETARRDQLAAELAERERDAEQLRVELQQVLPGLQARQQADRDVLDGIDAVGLPAGPSAAERVGAELTAIEQRITDVEAMLKPLLKQHAHAYEEARQLRSWR